MFRPFALIVPLLGLFSVASRAADIREALRQCESALAGTSVHIDIIARRQGDAWHISGLDLLYTIPTDAALERVATFTNLDSLRLYCTKPDCPGRLTAMGVRKLEALQRLRRLSIFFDLDEATVQAVCTLTGLEDLGLTGSYRASRNKGLVHLRNLRNLRQLDLTAAGLSDDSLEYIEPIKSLEELNLCRNDGITDAGLGRLNGLSNLRILQLEQLGVTGLSSLRRLPRLEHLSIVTFSPGGEKADLSVLRGLKRLDLYELDGDETVECRLPNSLRWLNVMYEIVGKLDLRSSQQIEHVQLGLSRNWPHQKDTRDLRWLNSLPQLRELTLEDSTDSDLAAIAAITSLRFLTLRSGCSTTFGDEGMKALAGLTRLERLTIDDSMVTDAGIDVLRRLTSLKEIRLASTPKVTDRGMANIWMLKRLRSLDLDLRASSVQRSLDSILAGVNTLGELKELRISGTLTEDGLTRLAGLKKLRFLDLSSSSGYTDDALASLASALPDLQVMKRSYGVQTDPDQTKK